MGDMGGRSPALGFPDAAAAELQKKVSPSLPTTPPRSRESSSSPSLSPSPDQPISKAAARKLRKSRNALSSSSSSEDLSPAVDSNLSASPRKKSTPPNNSPKARSKSPIQPDTPPPTASPFLLITSPTTITMPPNGLPPLSPLLVCSIGNPSPTYANTLHSAGHTVLSSLPSRLPLIYTPFAKDRSLANGLVSRPAPAPAKYPTSFLFRSDKETCDDWTLWQSQTLMNVSGNAVRDAWRQWIAGQGTSAPPPYTTNEGSDLSPLELRRKHGVLVIVHDELEKELGWVGIRKGSSSAKGHNGIKSIQARLSGSVPTVRIGIGIGRPKSREPDEVARYVLRKMTNLELEKIVGCAGKVAGLLREIEEGRRE